jgi:orotidine-5'-phosphate decarboxylase
LKADGAVIGATYPEKIREVQQILEEKTSINLPRIGAQGGSRGRCSISYCRKAITLAENPAEAAKKIRMPAGVE